VPNNIAQITASLRPDGQPGTPCADTVGVACQVAGGVTGTLRVTSSMAVSLTVPAGVIAAGNRANVFFTTTRGIENVACNPAVAGIATVCTGTLVGDALQGSTARVYSGGVAVATGTVNGLGPQSARQPLLPPPIVLPPPPPPPLVLLSSGAPFSGAALDAGVPIIPEAEPLVLLAAGLLLVSLRPLARRLGRCRG
jgi:hypothetical protein